MKTVLMDKNKSRLPTATAGCGSVIQSGAEQSEAEQSGAEQSGAEQSGAEQSGRWAVGLT